ncbi:MAG: MaoC family dehydratase [Pseudomonadota bacterium]|nr:MaoC family dehydratase [Pseudomonadota bacterium]
MSKLFYWEDFHPGQRIESPGITVTEGAIIDFAQRFDSQTFHMDREAARDSLYGGLIASGIHTMALTWRLLLMTGVLNANLGSPGFDELRWLRPVRPGDTLRAVAEVLEARPSTRHPDRGSVRLHCATINQREETVQTVLCNQLIARRRE